MGTAGKGLGGRFLILLRQCLVNVYKATSRAKQRRY